MQRLRMFLIFIFIFSMSALCAQEVTENPVDKAWDAAAKNNRKLMKSTLEMAVAKNPNDLRARLALYFLYEQEEEYEAAFNQLKMIPRIETEYYPYIHALMIDGPYTTLLNKRDKEAIKFTEEFTKKSDPTGTLKAMFIEHLGRHYESLGKFKKAEKLFANLHVVPNWQIIGPFNNISASGFDTPYPVESEFKVNKIYKGDNDMPLKWRWVRVIRRDQWLDYTNYSTNQSAVFYANNFIFSPVKKRVQIRIGTSGSLKFFLNDVEIISVFDENNNDLDTYIVEADLQQGWNRLLIKTGNSEINQNNFLVRITTERGTVPVAIKSDPQPHEYPSGAEANAKIVPIFAEEFFKEQIKAHPEQMENYLLLAKDYLRNDKAVEAEEVLQSALKLMPNATIIMNTLLEAYVRDGRQDELESLLEKMYKLDPNLVTPLNYRIERALKNENLDKAEKLINQFYALKGGNEVYFLKKIALEAAKKNSAEVARLIAVAYSKFQDNWDIVSLYVSFQAQALKNYDRAKTALEQYVKKHFNAGAYSTLALLHLTSQNISSITNFEKTFKKIFKIEPSEVYYYYKLADIYFKLQKYEDCVKILNQAIAMAPTISNLYSLQGMALKNLGEDEKAIEKLKKAIIYDATDYDAWESLRELQGDKNIFRNFDSYSIEQLIQSAPDASAASGTGAIILLDYVKRVVYPEGASESGYELLARVFNARGVDAFKEYWIDYARGQEDLIVEKAVVIKSDGTEIKGDISGGQVVFKSLEPNDFVHIRYKKKNYYRGKLSRHFWDRYQFNGRFPIQKVHYALLVPTGFKFYYKTNNFTIEPTDKICADGTLYEWKAEHTTPIEYEVGMPPYEDICHMLYISSIPDWNYIANWYSDLARTKTRTSMEIKQKVKELFDGKTELNKEEKIKTIYDFITENIHYSSVPFRQSGLIPQKARDVLVTRIGDCKDMATLAIAMLKEVGIEAKYTLVNTRQEGQNINSLPSIDFNHCIVAVPEDSGQYKFLDMTAKNHPYGVIPRLDKGAFSLVIDKKTEKPILLPEKQYGKSTLLRQTHIAFGKDNRIRVKTKSRREGYVAASFRSNYRDKSIDIRFKDLTEALNGNYTDVKIDSFTINDLERIDKPVSYYYEFTASSITTKTGNFMILNLPWSDDFEPLDGLSYEKRQYPYFYWSSTDTARQTITVDLPAGYRPVEMPAEVHYSSPVSDYKISYTFTGGRLVSTREVINKKREVSPEEYVQFKEYYNKVSKEDKRQILLKK